MKIAVVGSNDWNDYNTLIRKLSIEIEDWMRDNPEDNKLTFLHFGSDGAENMVTEFVGKIEKMAKQKGKIISDKVFYAKNKQDKYKELASYDIDKAIIFSKIPCKKSASFAMITRQYKVPTKIVMG